mmetsp:Transcript_8601/g.17460  ORF Transcript_8601/g.17460 Transcript_8601/m.17460 type:complete len:210 (-) Transcript_8601:408-1037(-)
MFGRYCCPRDEVLVVVFFLQQIVLPPDLRPHFLAPPSLVKEPVIVFGVQRLEGMPLDLPPVQGVVGLLHELFVGLVRDRCPLVVTVEVYFTLACALSETPQKRCPFLRVHPIRAVLHHFVKGFLLPVLCCLDRMPFREALPFPPAFVFGGLGNTRPPERSLSCPHSLLLLSFLLQPLCFRLLLLPDQPVPLRFLRLRFPPLCVRLSTRV